MDSLKATYDLVSKSISSCPCDCILHAQQPTHSYGHLQSHIFCWKPELTFSFWQKLLHGKQWVNDRGIHLTNATKLSQLIIITAGLN